jgi:hypothetical protein
MKSLIKVWASKLSANPVIPALARNGARSTPNSLRIIRKATQTAIPDRLQIIICRKGIAYRRHSPPTPSIESIYL